MEHVPDFLEQYFIIKEQVDKESNKLEYSKIMFYR